MNGRRQTARAVRQYGLVATLLSLAILSMTGCGSGSGGGSAQPAFPTDITRFTVLPGNQGQPTRYYVTSSSQLTPSGAAAVTRSDLLIYGHTRFAALDPATQVVNSAAVTATLGRYSIDAQTTNNGALAFSVADVINADRVVAEVTAPAGGLSQPQALIALAPSLGSNATASAVAEAISLVSSSR